MAKAMSTAIIAVLVIIVVGALAVSLQPSQFESKEPIEKETEQMTAKEEQTDTEGHFIPEQQFRVAEPQPWIADVMTQPVPPGASSTRFTSLPASIDKILLNKIGGFGMHQGGHLEGLDHEWIEVKDDTPMRSWADGEIIDVFLNNPSDPNSVYRVRIDFGDGLIGDFMDVVTPLVEKGDKVKAGDPIGFGSTQGWSSGYHSAEFYLMDRHRQDGIEAIYYNDASAVSPFDYLSEDLKLELIEAINKEIIEPYIEKGESIGTFHPWEPYLTNPMEIHKMHQGTLVGEWYLTSKNWIQDGTPDLLILLPTTKYYDKQRVMSAEDTGSGSYIFSGTWEADYDNNRVIFETKYSGTFYGIFELDETEPRAKLKIEYQTGSYPTQFSLNADTYTERANLDRRYDASLLGVIKQ